MIQRFLYNMFCLLSLCAGYVDVFAFQIIQSECYVEKWDVQRGLPQASVDDIMQAPNGLMIVQADKPYYFDGNHFRKFSLPAWDTISNMTCQQDSKENLYVFNQDIIQIISKSKAVLETIQLNEIAVIINRILAINQDFLLVSDNQLRILLIDKAIKKIVKVYPYQYKIDKHANYQVQKEIFRGVVTAGTSEFFAEINLTTTILSIRKVFRVLNYTRLKNGTNLFVKTDGLFTSHGQQDSLIKLADLPALAYIPQVAQAVENSDGIWLALDNRIFHFNQLKVVFDQELTSLEGHAIADADYIRRLMTDDFGTIYCIFNFSGLARIYPPPQGIRFFGSRTRIDFCKTVTVQENGERILLTTINNGISVYDRFGSRITKITSWDLVNEEMLFWACYYLTENKYVCLLKPSFNSTRFTIIRFSIVGEKVHVLQRHQLELPSAGYFTGICARTANQLEFNISTNIISVDLNRDSIIKIKTTLTKQANVATVKIQDQYWSVGADGIRIHDENGQLLKHMANQSQGTARCLKQLSDSLVLVGFDHGLLTINRYTDQIDRWERVEDCIYAIELEGDQVWCSTNHGVICIRDKRIIRRFGGHQQGIGQEYNTNSACQTGDGRLLFGGVGGLVAIKPDELDIVDIESQTIIGPILIDNSCIAQYDDYQSPIVLRPGETSVRVQVATIGPEPSHHYRTQYLIPGMTKGWVDAGLDGVINHSFKPGRYQLFYHSNPLFQPQKTPVDYIDFDVRTYWYETDFFIISSLVVLCGIIVLFFRARMKMINMKRQRRIELDRSLQQERDRISRELHDDIGVQLGIIGRSINFLRENKSRLSENIQQDQMKELEQISEEVNRSLRDAIWANKKPTFTFQDVLNRLATLVYRLNEAGRRTTIEDEVQQSDLTLLPSEALNLFRILQELLNNAVKHAHSTNIRVRISYPVPQVIVIEVQDDGVGYDQQSTFEGNGLKNIRRRATESNFVLETKSVPGGGTKVKLIIKRIANDFDRPY